MIKENKYYYTREGDVVGPTKYISVGFSYKDANNVLHYVNKFGQAGDMLNPAHNVEHLDLVEEVPSKRPEKVYLLPQNTYDLVWEFLYTRVSANEATHILKELKVE